jgi:hypothetical protein
LEGNLAGLHVQNDCRTKSLAREILEQTVSKQWEAWNPRSGTPWKCKAIRGKFQKDGLTQERLRHEVARLAVTTKVLWLQTDERLRHILEVDLNNLSGSLEKPMHAGQLMSLIHYHATPEASSAQLEIRGPICDEVDKIIAPLIPIAAERAQEESEPPKSAPPR